MPYYFGNHYTVSGYTLTNNPEEVDNDINHSEEIQKIIHKAYQLTQHPKKDTLPKLLKWVNKYPHIPEFKNYLTSYYISIGNKEKAFKANKWLIKEHPNYLFGKLNLAGQYLLEEKYEEIPDVLGETLDLKALYPEREIFHFNEFLSFLNISCQYLIAIGELDVAASRIYPIAEVLPDNPKVQFLIDLLEEAKMKEEEANRPKGRPYALNEQTTIAPTFNHSEINALYEYGFDIDPVILKNILALPPYTLLEDLQKVLRDSIIRYEYFLHNHQEEACFPLHALFLLTELKAESSLDIILDYLKNNESILEFWFHDHYTETIWSLIYHIGQEKLHQLKVYQFEPNIAQYSKSAAMEAIVQIALNQPERRSETIQWFKEVGEYFLTHSDNIDLIDKELIGGMVFNISELQARELLPLIKDLYDKNLVSEFIAGPYEEIEKEMEEPIGYRPPSYVDIYTSYTYFMENWHKVVEDIDIKDLKIQALEEKKSKLEQELAAAKSNHEKLLKQLEKTGIDTSKLTKHQNLPKVGRNEPCPCGSGNKYKKCCLRK